MHARQGPSAHTYWAPANAHFILNATQMSKRGAWGVVAFSAIVGPLIVALNFGSFILGLYMFGLVIGGLYSVPPFQFKRFPVMAGLTIACVRGFLLNFGVYYAVKEALGYPFSWNPSVIFLARFMTVFAGVIAITKYHVLLCAWLLLP